MPCSVSGKRTLHGNKPSSELQKEQEIQILKCNLSQQMRVGADIKEMVGEIDEDFWEYL